MQTVRTTVSYRDVDYNPGGTMARRNGCTCPVLDNHYGEGVIVNGEAQFWVNPDCPFHRRADEQNPTDSAGQDQS